MSGVIAKLRLYGEGSVRGVLYDLGDYPGAVLNPASKSSVHGTGFQLPDTSTVLDALDRYEDYDPASPGTSQFVRKLCSVTLYDGAVVACWIYEFNGNTKGTPIIASGHYRKRNGSTC